MKIRRPSLGQCFVDLHDQMQAQRSRLIFMMRAYSLTDEERFFLLSKVQDLEYDIDMARVFATDHGKGKRIKE